jgi:hypothetical protein
VLERAGVVIVPNLVKSEVDAFSRCGPTAIIFLNQAIKSTSRWHFDIGAAYGGVQFLPETSFIGRDDR